MALNRKSKVKEIFENQEAYDMLLKHVPGCTKDAPGIEAALGMTIQALLSFPASKCPKETRVAFFEELEAANIE